MASVRAFRSTIRQKPARLISPLPPQHQHARLQSAIPFGKIFGGIGLSFVGTLVVLGVVAHVMYPSTIRTTPEQIQQEESETARYLSSLDAARRQKVEDLGKRLRDKYIVSKDEQTRQHEEEVVERVIRQGCAKAAKQEAEKAAQVNSAGSTGAVEAKAA